MLYFLRKIIPKPLLSLYHRTLAWLAAVWYRHPSEELFVIGVTGTNGKSSTVQFIAQMLEYMGETVGYTTTAGFRIAGESIENRMKMTMPGRFYLQSLLRQMGEKGCKYAVIETSSQGIAQYRHVGINYDMAVFTNLTPEHLESHGGFDAYKEAKGMLFAHLARSPRKMLFGERVEKVSVINGDDIHAGYFASFPADRVVQFGLHLLPGVDAIAANLLKQSRIGTQLRLHRTEIVVPFLAEFQVKNALAAIAALVSAGFSWDAVLEAAEHLEPIPGRFELINEGQDFSVVVDYAYEPYALEALFQATRALKPKRIIGVHGSAGGGRDIARRPQIGKLAAEYEDIVIVTNEDPYDEDPRTIMEQVAEGARETGKHDGHDLFVIEDREKAIARAIQFAEPGDVVLLTGKGNEPVIAGPRGKKIPWSDKASAIRAINARTV